MPTWTILKRHSATNQAAFLLKALGSPAAISFLRFYLDADANLSEVDMSDVFVSYANEDRAWAQMLARALEGRGWSIFWDRTIPIGKTWREIIGRELKEARCVVVIWSKASIASGWVQEEADDAKKRGILVPVLIEGVEPPIGFRSIQTADLSDWNATEPTQAFQRLIDDISRLIGSPSTPKEAPPAGPPPTPPPLPKWRTRRSLAIGGAIIVIGAVFAYQFVGPRDSPIVDENGPVYAQSGGGKEVEAARVEGQRNGDIKEAQKMTDHEEARGRGINNYTLQVNQDIDGQDIVAPDGQVGIRSSDVNACAVQCDGNPSCAAFSFDRWNKMCFLKKTIVTSLLEPRSAIGVKKPSALPNRSTLPVQLRTVYKHRFLAQPIAAENVSDLKACQALCFNDRRCVAFSFLKGGGQARNCQIFDNVQDAYMDDPSADSGWKEQPR
ncbi:TIR domain-containing protein [Bradyrhizobium sp. CCBAU 51765]|uniref:TIR domain-containing protein n=1 Tax=Bradyrhizobium sp. CCBAU 51765 TaxID=1325102 RepID=UPI001887F4D5|nr:TIR domain-containing protein [Bradyrhizobium sp. CCBAU 51765]